MIRIKYHITVHQGEQTKDRSSKAHEPLAVPEQAHPEETESNEHGKDANQSF